MFTPKTGTGFPSSASGRALASSSRRRSSVGGLGTPYGGVSSRTSQANRSPYVTPGSRITSGGGGSILGPQNAFNVESVGSSLPALVMEALTFADKGGEMSVVLSACGWAWLVTGRRLLVWRYINKEGGSSGPHTPLSSAGGTPVSRSSRHPVSSQTEFRELLLPQSELTHRAQLVVLRQHDSQQMPSCMAVSPEGAVRYWPSIAQESSYTEVTAELQGQECDSLVYLSNSLGYFLATTTSTTLLLMPSPAPHHGVTVRQVKVPAGLLGGLSRRVTSLMFGSLPTQAPEARLVRVVCRSTAASGSVVVLVLSAEYLQCWQLSPGQPDTLLYQTPLLQHCQQALAAKVQSDALTKPGAAIWLLDAQPQPRKPHLVSVLVAAVSTSSAVPGRQQDLILALATVDTSSCPESVSHVTIIQHGESLPQPYSSSSSGQEGGAAGDSSTTPPPPAALMHYRLVLCNATAFIYNRTGVVCVPCNDATIALGNRVSFTAPNDGVLGAGRLPPPSRGAAPSSIPPSTPIFFSATQGIVALVSNSATSGALAQAGLSQCAEEVDSIIMGGATVDALTSASSSPAHRLQAAFMIYIKGDTAAAQSILNELFPGGDYSELPHACLTLSRNLLDDTPATDPRWAEARGGGGLMGGVAGIPFSLIITNQIRDKAAAHKYYITFLQETGLWSQLPSPSLPGDRAASSQPCVRAAMLEHVQRLAFAAALRTQHQQHQLLLDQAIGEVIESRGEAVTGRLTPADLFYCRITLIHEIVWGLMQAVEQIIAADVVPRDAPASLHTVATLLLALLKAATSVTSATSSGGVGGTPGRELVPWTATEGSPKGIRTLLIALHKAIVETGLQHAEDAPTKAKLYATIVELTDQILAGYQPQLASLVQPGTTLGTPAPRFESSYGSVPLKFHRDGLMPSSVSGQQPFMPETATPINHERYQHLLKEYQKQRAVLIQPLVSGGQYSQALSLAEKYCDFRTLVEVCDITENSSRLDGYMHQFAAQGFSDFVFRWHLETGKRGRLLGYGGGEGGGGEWSNELSRFLKGYSGLEWVHQLSTRDFAAAHLTLKEQGMQESTYLARKKTLLSLSKLCRIADGYKQDNTVDEMDQSEPSPADPLSLEEDLILYQEQLPAEVLEAHNLDTSTMRVLTPVEMIQLYTGEENRSASEVDFKKALDLLAFVPSLEEAEDLKIGIWMRAVLRDTWTNLDTDAPLEAISDTLFFKTIELAFTQGSSLKDLLVPCEELLAQDDLQELCKDSGFSFLVQAGYEKIQQLVA